MENGNKKTILVTGGAGFIGSHLCGKLLARGDKIICLDNFFTGSRNNVAPFLKNKNFTLVERDIVDGFACGGPRSEERRVGKECRCRWSP